MKLIKAIKKFLSDTSQSVQLSAQSVQLSAEIREGIANQSDLINKKMTEMNSLLRQQNELLSKRSAHLVGISDGFQSPPSKKIQPFEEALQRHPLMFARKTFNTNHPDYDAAEARNFPGKIFNIDKNPANPIYSELRKLMHDSEIPEQRWSTILEETLKEVKTVPHAEQVFERKAFVEKYMEELEAKYGAYYKPGWVNLDDALFLYWVVRRLKPKVIVQTGVCNGLSSAFMMLALAKNGPDGTLHVVDMPPVFDSKDDAWKIKDKVYGVVIPEGKTSGWIVPDAYQHRFEVLSGDAKLLLPGLLKKLGKVDMFYHDSDHTYDHMMFEFKEAKNYLTKDGVIVSDDISWNASLWDFADEYLAPAYNYRGSMGVACF